MLRGMAHSKGRLDAWHACPHLTPGLPPFRRVARVCPTRRARFPVACTISIYRFICQRRQSDFPHLFSRGYLDPEGEAPDLGVSRQGGSARPGVVYARPAVPEIVSKSDKFSWTETSGDHHTPRNRLSSIGFVGAAASSAALLQNSRETGDPLPLPRGQNLRKRGFAALHDHTRARCRKRPRALHRHHFDCCCHTFSCCCQRGRHHDGRHHSRCNTMGRSIYCLGVHVWCGLHCEHDVSACVSAAFVQLGVLCPVEKTVEKIIEKRA